MTMKKVLVMSALTVEMDVEFEEPRPGASSL